MRIYSHGIIGYLIYRKARPEHRRLAVLGAVTPDVLLSIGFVFHYLGESRVVSALHDLFHHSVLHSITESMHSIVISGSLLLASYLVFRAAVQFFVGMISHGIIDLLTHRQSGYNHFLPIPVGEIVGPLSYTWIWFSVVEHVLVLLFFLWLFRRRLPGLRRLSL